MSATSAALALTLAVAALLAGLAPEARAQGGGANCDDPRTLRVALIPKSDPQRQRAQVQPLLQALERTLQRRVELVPGASYGAVVEGLLSGAVDVAELGPASYTMVVSRQADAIAPFAALAGQDDATSVGRYHSVLMVRRDAGVASLAALRGRTLALIDPASTSGALLPRQAVRELTGTPLEQHFGRVSYAGSHDRAIAAVREGRVDAAFVSSARVAEAERQGRLLPGEWQALWRSVPIPTDPFVARQRLCAPVRDAIARAFLSGDEALRPMLDAFGGPAFVPVSDGDYRALRERLATLN